MLVRVLVYSFDLGPVQSLKAKRMVVRSGKDRLISRFKMSVAETAFQDVTSRAELSMAFVASDVAQADRRSEQIDRFIEETIPARIVDVKVETHGRPR